MEEYNNVLAIFILGIPFFVMVVLAMTWAAKNGQFQNLEEASRSIFDEDEPEGRQIDFFPGKNKNNRNFNK
ncbi:MAG: hypothetical protein COZ46_05020 [Verrucomicrobia bacterium CG_4_10_14_3_um_filter_43_23]|nr:MAG: hypothetical protein AUJ82_05350 [Verrucomicrobia bacterium CG1_02_43_26]PIP58752.1 MAG: hypothetical protein COX01_06990 [Verrucomicrobia bacterium CG22_combo_CG10-13_8_21_14_all_43_17]PIX58202.1 MAG: hypothetical protein COZ46_05020 [Verrucomicrobia bacterium CG_4_10_14_3_um_filter_43_23]PIY61537.1 MAG: hypothetical protein COY94_05015 [Verrucomicrobia bacterium CG_4_10_14_0_8_um_filter_43_34]PJA44395.1 MAG: hypothetical protein CO175_03025 [Verrucomicrobia bacterium CG_4_9_14_3_um_fi